MILSANSIPVPPGLNVSSNPAWNCQAECRLAKELTVAVLHPEECRKAGRLSDASLLWKSRPAPSSLISAAVPPCPTTLV